MGSDTVKATRLSRRDVLKAAGAVVALPLAAYGEFEPAPQTQGTPASAAPSHNDPPAGEAPHERAAHEPGDSEQTPAAPPTSQATGAVRRPPHWLADDPVNSRVVDVRSERVLVDSVVDRLALSDMFEKAIRELTGAGSTQLAWRQILGNSQRVLLKFNAIGNELLRVNEPVAVALVHQLVDSGFPADSISLLETPEYLNGELGVRTPARGWGPAIAMGDRDEPVLNAIWEADAVISVGLLKTHQISGISACMKNISHGILRRPALYHADRCAASIVQVFGNPELTKRFPLFIVNALRVIVRGGPDATPGDISNYGGIILGRDPLAVDAIGFGVIEAERRKQAQVGALDAPYLRLGASAGLGRWRAGEVVRVAVDI